MSALAAASVVHASTVDEAINDAVSPVANFISGIIFYSIRIGDPDDLAYIEIPLIVVWLIVAAAFFTVCLGFQNIRGFRHALDLVRGKYSNPTDAGEVSHFQALATAVSGTVGLGNIAGAAVAVSLGGPGATFWMILAGFLGTSTKMAPSGSSTARSGRTAPSRAARCTTCATGSPNSVTRSSANSSPCSSPSAALAARSAGATCSGRTRPPPRSSTSPAARTAPSASGAS